MGQADRPAEEKQGRRLLEAHRRHDRHFRDSKYVYPVLSRRSQGISVGINLNPDRRCNFDCVYCQVERGEPAPGGEVEVEKVLSELDLTIDLVDSGQLFEDISFQNVPSELRIVKDVAFSGDGEPTTCRGFDKVVEAVVERLKARTIKLVLITNASQLHREAVIRGVSLITASGGEVWGKLDAGTEAYYQAVNRCATPFSRILDNLSVEARRYPIVIQSLFLRLRGEAPDEQEISAYCKRLGEITESGGRIDRVQIHTIARPPAESFVAPLETPVLEAIGREVRRCTGLTTEVHGGH